jgi:sulfur-oxidizing protein SoxY
MIDLSVKNHEVNIMQQSRRLFLRATLAAGSIAAAAAAGALIPRTVLAAWPEKAFKARDLDTALLEIVGGTELTPSDQIKVKVPDIAENGAVVSFTVTHSIPGAESLSILVPENGNKLAASYQLSSKLNSYVSGRIKMRKTSDVIAVIKAGEQRYVAKGHVKVTLGGCGG